MDTCDAVSDATTSTSDSKRDQTSLVIEEIKPHVDSVCKATNETIHSLPVHKSIRAVRLAFVDKNTRDAKQCHKIIEYLVTSGLAASLVKHVIVENLDESAQQDILVILTNIASGTPAHAEYLTMDLRVVPLLMERMKHANTDIVMPAIWALANLCGESEKQADAYIAQGLDENMTAITRCLTFPFDADLQCRLIVLAGNVCMVATKLEFVLKWQRFIAVAAMYSSDPRVKLDASAAIARIASRPEADLALSLIGMGVAKYFVKCIKMDSVPGARMSRTVCQMMDALASYACNEDHRVTNALIAAGLFEAIGFHLRNSTNMTQVAFWIASNISDPAQIDSMANAGLYPFIFKAAREADCKTNVFASALTCVVRLCQIRHRSSKSTKLLVANRADLILARAVNLGESKDGSNKQLAEHSLAALAWFVKGRATALP